MVYPKVKVREEFQEDGDDFDVQGERKYLILLKDFEKSLSLKDHHIPSLGKEHRSGSPPLIARIPKDYTPSIVVPSISALKGEKQMEDDKGSNTKASSVPRPRAVLSSPDNDGMIGHMNMLTRGRSSILKKNGSVQNMNSQVKVNPVSVNARRSPVSTRREPKGTMENKKSRSPIKIRRVSEETSDSMKARSLVSTRWEPKGTTENKKSRSPIKIRRVSEETSDSMKARSPVSTRQEPEGTTENKKSRSPIKIIGVSEETSDSMKARSPINTRQESKETSERKKARSPLNTRREPKESSGSKTYLNIMRSPDLIVPKPKTCLRKAKSSSNVNAHTH